MGMTHLLYSGLKYLIPQWWEFASYTDAKGEEMNLLNAQSPEYARGSHCCKPQVPCFIASCSWKSERAADPHTSPAETPQGHFCKARYKMRVGYKTNVPHNPAPFPKPLLSCLLPEDTGLLCQNGPKEKPTLAMPAGEKGQGCRLCSLTKTLKSGHSLFLVAFPPTVPQRI